MFFDNKFEGLMVFTPKKFIDSRGFFYESFNQNLFVKNLNRNIDFIQDNHSKSGLGVIRGMHYQKKPFEQAKLVRVIKGSIYDVVIDIRKNSKTYMEYFTIVLSSENCAQLFIPEGFAHGFQALEENTEVLYKTNNIYSKNDECHINPLDPKINIKWPIEKMLFSDKDKLPSNYEF